MMNSLLATSLVLLLSLGFGCSQDAQLFNYTDSCVKIMMVFEVNVTYMQTDGNRSSVIIPAANFTDDVITKCAEGIASIEIPWPEDFSLIINFVADIEQSWNLSSVGFEYSTQGNERYFDNPQYDGDTMNGTIEEIPAVDWNTSYSCSINSSVNLTSEVEETNQTAEIIIPSIQVQVFSFSTPGEFDTGRGCLPGGGSGSSDDDDDKIVPIAVGCALAGLVIIVLIAYLIGRYRNRKTDTYQVLS